MNDAFLNQKFFLENYYRLNPDFTVTSFRDIKDKKEKIAVLEKGTIPIVKTIHGGFEVSSVFLMMDHSAYGNIPVLFETMIFLIDGNLNNSERIEKNPFNDVQLRAVNIRNCFCNHYLATRFLLKYLKVLDSGDQKQLDQFFEFRRY